MREIGTRAALFLGSLPFVVGILYIVLIEIDAGEMISDAAGGTMLIALGFAMAFGFWVLLRGAKDL